MFAPAPAITDALFRLRGTVQGVGFRPFVHRLALRHDLCGWVRNDAQGVLIRVVGPSAQVDSFAAALTAEAPPASHIDAIESRAPTSDDDAVTDRFAIVASAATTEEITAAIPADLALCADCRRELFDAGNRRRGYPFINCTQCGPRYSLIEQLPYDRPRTTMRAFAMCRTCEREYREPANRRYHAEPNACPDCGPQLTLRDPAGNALAAAAHALPATVQALRDGRIVAVKGVGGFHLMCDAANDLAVAQLRVRKHREEKPLAVMFRDLDALRAHADVSPDDATRLQSTAAPIVLVQRHPESSLAAGLAPDNPWLGALLPYAPLHVLLLAAFPGPLVATSANLSEEPICTDNDDARARLAGIADLFLEHDRPIAHPVDDSVVRHAANGDAILLRRARGYAPAPLKLPQPFAQVHLCVGGQMKNTVGIASGDQLILSPHLGDLGNAPTQAVFERTIRMLGTLHGAAPAVVVHDKHPDYSSTTFAGRLGLPCIAVQHHLAHVLACLLENNHEAHDVLGIAWDGTGYGEDGTIWGGEFIRLERGRATRFARLRPFRLAGGEAAVRNPRRVALGLAHELGLFSEMAVRLGFTVTERATLRQMLHQGLNAPLCTSGGRLFDGAAALLGLCDHNRFEGQAPLAVEAAATRRRDTVLTLPFDLMPSVSGGAAFEVDWAPAVRQLAFGGRAPEELAAALHRGLAEAMVSVARRADVSTVALTGGCFQNALLHELAATALRQAGFRVLVHRQLSPNDNSIAAGQALGALWNLTTVHSP